jgi:two-component system response regulator FixJ
MGEGGGGLVVAVEDDARLRDSLAVLLRAAGHRAAAFGSAEELLEAGVPAGALCLVLDVRMPGMDGVALLEELRRRGDRTPVVVLTGHGDIPLAVRAMRAGASDFVEKPCGDEQLLGAIERAAAQRAVPALAPDAGRAAEAAGRLAALSQREREVLEGLLAGKSNKVIAHELGVSVRTVEGHRGNMMGRLGVRSLAAAVRLAIEAGHRR